MTAKVPILIVALFALASFANLAAVAGDPSGDGRVKVKMPNMRSGSSAEELQGIVVLCAQGETCEPKDADDANGAKSPARNKPDREAGAPSSAQPVQHNQTDSQFLRERAQ